MSKGQLINNSLIFSSSGTIFAEAIATSGNFTFNGPSGSSLLLSNVTDPISLQDAATKNYVDNSSLTCYAATTANLTATYANGTSGIGATLTNSGTQSAFTIDGVSPTTGTKILVKNQTSNVQNGIYVLTIVGSGSTNWVLTRSSIYNTPTLIQSGLEVYINNGTINGGSAWMQSAIVVTIGTSPIIFTSFIPITALTGDVTAIGPGSVSSIVSSINGKSIVLGGSLTTSGANALTLTTTGTTNVTLPTSGTLLSNIPAALTEINDTNITLTLGGTPATALLQATSITAGWTGQLSLARGGSNASLTASNGGIFYSTASAGAILSGTATANTVLLSGASTAPLWSTATYPATTTANQILYSNAANTVTGLTTANSSILATNSSGIPSITNILPNIFRAMTPTTLTAGTTVTVTAAQWITGLIIWVPTGTGVLTTPTAAQIITALGGAAIIGTTIKCIIQNASTTVSFTIVPGTGVSTSPPSTSTYTAGTNVNMSVFFGTSAESAAGYWHSITSYMYVAAVTPTPNCILYYG